MATAAILVSDQMLYFSQLFDGTKLVEIACYRILSDIQDGGCRHLGFSVKVKYDNTV